MRKLSRLLVAAAVLAAFAVVVLLSASIYTFARLTDETLVAEIRFEAVGPDRYLAHIDTADFCAETVLPIEGDQWRIDAQFVKWHYWATLLGLDSQYRLDRFEGRYSDVERQNRVVDNAYALRGATTLDVVTIADSLGSLNVLLDASYGSSTYETIATDRIFEVYKSTTGLLTRSRPAADRPSGDALEIEIRNACGGEPGPWERLTTWIDRTAVGLIGGRTAQAG